MWMTRQIYAIVLLVVGTTACGRHRLNQDEIERNRLYAAILEREDRRDIGSDGFFDSHLKNSPYPEVRVWCAVALGRIGNPGALPLLHEAMRADLAAVRAASAFAVGEIEDRNDLGAEHRTRNPASLPGLVRLLEDSSPEVRKRAVEAIGKAGSAPEAQEIVRRLDQTTYDGTPVTRAFLGQVITALMRIRNPESFAVLRRLARRNDPEIQWQAANALIRVGDKTALPVFLRLLDSPHSDIRAYAARGIGMCQDPALWTSLIDLLPPVDGKTGRLLPLQVRASAASALSQLKVPSSVPAISAAIGNMSESASPEQVNFAVQAASTLGSIGARASEQALARLVRLPGPVANAALVALARILKPAPRRFFEIVDPSIFADPVGTRAWAQALGELGGVEAVLELKNILIRSADERASQADLLAVPSVLTALAKAGAPDLGETLQPFLASHDAVALRAAIGAYNPPPRMHDPWLPILQAYEREADSRDIETKVAVLDRLRPWLKEKPVEVVLRLALSDRLRNVRIAAAALLREAGRSNVPDDPGPSETTTARGTYELLAGSRKDRTVALLETTRGHVEIEMFREDAPLTVSNFVSLARRGFFDGLSFMRVVPFFVVQGGDPRNDQEGGPGYSIRCEINMHPFERGSVGMALAGKDTGGSQFFITLAPQPHLDGGYTCFGRVISGMQAVDNLIPGDRINKVTITEDRAVLDFHRY